MINLNIHHTIIYALIAIYARLLQIGLSSRDGCNFRTMRQLSTQFFLGVIALVAIDNISWLRDDFCQFWSQRMVDNIRIFNGSPLAVAKKCMVQNLENVLNLNVCQTEPAKPGGCDTLQDEWQIHPTLGFKQPGLCLTRWAAVGDGLIYFSQNCHFGIFFWSCFCFFFYIYSGLSP